MSVKLDGREVKVGDRLWCFCYGWGTVGESRYNISYPLLIVWDDKNFSPKSYNCCGITTGKNRTLFWNEIKFEIPQPPKKKIKKWQWICLGTDGRYFLTGYHYATIEEAEKTIRTSSVEGKLECSVIEVEEE